MSRFFHRRKDRDRTTGADRPGPRHPFWGVPRKRADIGPEDWVIVSRPLLPTDAQDLDRTLPTVQRPPAATFIYWSHQARADAAAGRRDRRHRTVITLDTADDTGRTHLQVWSPWLQELQHLTWHGCENERTEIWSLIMAVHDELVTVDEQLARCPDRIAAARAARAAAEQVEPDPTPRSPAEADDPEHLRLDRRRRDRDHDIAAARADELAAEHDQAIHQARIRALLDRREHLWRTLLSRIDFDIEHCNRRAHVYLAAARLRVRPDTAPIQRPVWASMDTLPPPPPLRYRPDTGGGSDTGDGDGDAA